MTVPPDEGRDASTQPPAREPEPFVDFDPYRFGRPEQPVPPEFAPPGYIAPPPTPVMPQYPYTPSPPPPRPPYGYPYGGPYPPQPAHNTKAVVALVLGILAILLSWLSVWDLLLIVPAIVLGALGRNEARRAPEKGGKGMATAGLICGLVAFVLAIVSFVYIYHRIKPCMDDYDVGSKAFQTCATDRLLGRN